MVENTPLDKKNIYKRKDMMMEFKKDQWYRNTQNNKYYQYIREDTDTFITFEGNKERRYFIFREAGEQRERRCTEEYAMLGAFKEDVLYIEFAKLKRGDTFWHPQTGYGILCQEQSEEYPFGMADYNQDTYKFDDVLNNIDSIFTSHHQAIAFYLEYYRDKKKNDLDVYRKKSIYDECISR